MKRRDRIRCVLWDIAQDVGSLEFGRKRRSRVRWDIEQVHFAVGVLVGALGSLQEVMLLGTMSDP